MLVQQILNSKGDHGVITIHPDTLLSEAARILADKKIGGVVVSKDGIHAVGILSERDIVRQLARTGASCLKDPASSIMTPDPICCGKQDSSDHVLTLMTDGRFRHMPVVENGELKGIVTIGDVVKARLQQLSMEKTALEDMIMGR